MGGGSYMQSLTCLIKYSNVAKAIEAPSLVLVPLPSSSNITREFDVAEDKMLDASLISDMKVLFLLIMSSSAPILKIATN